MADVRSKYYEVYWRVEIEERDYVGDWETMKLTDNPSPIRITWDKGYDWWEPVKGSECTINILSETTFQYMHMFTADPRRFRVSVMRNNVLYWRGFVVADLYNETFARQSEVALKAVDGFRLLSGEPFERDDRSISIHELLRLCVEKLELSMPISDWMDMTHRDMPTQVTALAATYIDAGAFGQIYAEATWRDVIDFCLKPFALQLFQSGGSVHVRRAVSLYKDERPLSFYKVGGDLGIGWLTTADGHTITTADGNKLGTKQTRDRIESMWDKDINLLDTSLVEIIPAVRSVEVEVEDKRLDNVGIMTGWFNKRQWGDNAELKIVYAKKEVHMEWGRNLYSQSDLIEPAVFEWWGPTFDQTYNEMTINFNIKLTTTEYWINNPDVTEFKWSASITYDDGNKQWVGNDGNLYDEVQMINAGEGFADAPVECKLTIKEIPNNGTLDIQFRREKPSRVEDQVMILSDFELKLSVDDKYDVTNAVKLHNNYANNIDEKITIPVSDILAVPNAQYIFQLYFANAAGDPIRLWHDGKVADTLANHIASTALLYKGGKSRCITGPMLTKAHIDLNTVVQDDVYTKAAYYVDAIDLDCMLDEYEVELKEMPGLITGEVPVDGVDCINVWKYDNDVVGCYKCGEGIVTRHMNNAIIHYDFNTNMTKILMTESNIVSIMESENGVVVNTRTQSIFFNARGSVDKTINVKNNHDNWSGFVGMFEANGVTMRIDDGFMIDWNLKGCSSVIMTNDNNYYDYRSIILNDVFYKEATIIANGKDAYAPQSLIFDRRLGKGYNATSLRTLHNEHVLDINNYHYVTLHNGGIRVWRRNGNADVKKAELLWEKAQVGLTPYNFGVLNNSQLFYGRGTSAWIYDTVNSTDKRVRLPSDDKNVVGAKYIGRSFYVITTRGIHKVVRTMD